MARPLRVEYAGAVHHVMARGIERGSIFGGDEHRDGFLSILARVVREKRWVVHAYCLMPNHYHLLVETPLPTLSIGVQLLNGRYGQLFNRRTGRRGHLFEDRFRSIVVEKESYLLELCRYLVLNPVRAGLVADAGRYRWSSYRATAGLVEAPGFLETRWVLEQFGVTAERARAAYRRFVAEGVARPSPMAEVTGQVFLGGPAFLDEIRRRISSAPEALASAIPRAQREVGFVGFGDVVTAVAREYGIGELELCASRTRGEERALLVALARQVTGVSGAELGRRLGVTPGRVSQLARRAEELARTDWAERLARLARALANETGIRGPSPSSRQRT